MDTHDPARIKPVLKAPATPIDNVVRPSPPQATSVVTLYVRRDDSYPEPARTIALRPIPQGPENKIGEGSSAEDALLWAGFSIDGDSAVLTVTPLTRVTWPLGAGSPSRPRPKIDQVAKGEIEPQSLSTALQKVQAALHVWLRSYGHDVKFA